MIEANRSEKNTLESFVIDFLTIKIQAVSTEFLGQSMAAGIITLLVTRAHRSSWKKGLIH